MSINILTTIQKNLGYPVLKKIDPNTQEIKVENRNPDINKLGQAAIPSVLAGINNLSKSDEGLADIVNEPTGADWIALIFGENKNAIINNVSQYAMYDMINTETKMNEIAVEAVKLIRENKKQGDKASVEQFIADQRNNFYPFIPGAIHVGDLLHDNTIDDRTHQMQGPVSSLMHKLESGFSKPETAGDVQKKSKNF